MARIAPERSNFFVRSNYEIGTRRESHQPPVRQQESLEPAARTLLALTEQAIARIHQGLEIEAALHELAVSPARRADRRWSSVATLTAAERL